MARAVALASFIVLAAGQGLALPSVETVPQMGEWHEAAAEAQTAATASVTEAINQTESTNTSLPRMMGTQEQPQQHAVQEAVLDAIMREMQSILKNTFTVPGWENMDSAADNIKQIVDRVRERLATAFSESDGAHTPMTTAAALRGVTNDILKEIMVQEAVIETLWAVLRDSQARPWINNESHAMHISATQAVQNFLSRMHDRLRTTGFTDEEIMRMMPHSKTCSPDGFNGPSETCPERNLGKKGFYRSYGRGFGYGGTFGYPYYSYGYGYPSYGYSSYYSYPFYGYSYGYPSYGPRHWYYRRLGEMSTPEPVTPSMGVPTTPMHEQLGFPTVNTVNGPVGLSRPEMMGPFTGMGAADRMLQGYGGYRHGHGGYGHGGYGYGHGGYGYGHGGYGYGHGGYGHGHGYGHSHGGYGHGQGGWDHGYGHGHGWGQGHGSWGHGRDYWRRLEVPDLDVPQSASIMTNERATETTPTTTGRTTGFTQNTFRRAGETRLPMTPGSYVTPTTPLSETPVYPEGPLQETANTWETTTYLQ